ncbi:XdhC family protein [Gordonia sp. LSe1-13]|uniref:XdhC family protein n=1 Tax=Gordonia sesuvii TaxID=3116777 RepID=A0ABU7MCT3_9ACTN|nr:XdhC family protein [Gordonia sp. LSe1-13]
MTPDDRRSLAELAADYAGQRIPFAHATVVRAAQPTSAHPGDHALVTADGRMDGFAGGQCAAESVRLAAVDAITEGHGVLLRILPGDAEPYPEAPGARVAVNPCLSGGALEIFIEPVLPPPVVHVVGDTPIARGVVDQGRLLGFDIAQVGGDELEGADRDGFGGAVAAIVATHGGDESGMIRRALDSGVPFVGLVASRKRGAAVLDAMGLTTAERERVHTPVGLDIGARTPAEIALSVFAELVAAVRRDGLAGSGAAARREIDPICGMTILVADDTPEHVDDTGRHWFCCTGCRDTFIARSAGGLQAAR